MSVPTRNRKTSPLQFFATAIDIRVEVTRLMSSTAVIPKHWRFTFGEPACADAKRLVDHIERADAFYPNSQHNVTMRRHYLTEAVADCHVILQDLQCACDAGLPVPLARLERVVGLLDEEIGLLKGARKAVKLTGGAQAAPALEDEVAELMGCLTEEGV